MDTHDEDGRPLYELGKNGHGHPWEVWLGGKDTGKRFTTLEDAQDWIDNQPTPEPDPEVVAQRAADTET